MTECREDSPGSSMSTITVAVGVWKLIQTTWTTPNEDGSERLTTSYTLSLEHGERDEPLASMPVGARSSLWWALWKLTSGRERPPSSRSEIARARRSKPRSSDTRPSGAP